MLGPVIRLLLCYYMEQTLFFFFLALFKKNDRTAPQMRFGMFSTCYHLKKNIDSFLAAPAAFVVE